MNVDKARKRLDELSGRRETVRAEIGKLESDANGLDVTSSDAIQKLEQLENKLATRRRVLSALGPKVQDARAELDAAEQQVREKQSKELRQRIDKKRQEVAEMLLAVQSVLDDEQDLRGELSNEYSLSSEDFFGNDLRRVIHQRINHIRDFKLLDIPAESDAQRERHAWDGLTFNWLTR